MTDNIIRFRRHPDLADAIGQVRHRVCVEYLTQQTPAAWEHLRKAVLTPVEAAAAPLARALKMARPFLVVLATSQPAAKVALANIDAALIKAGEAV